ncbi:uncharacterized protein LY89DRAFT_736536 [Mollisia scopiformis]|uniref:Uncharacterized protein n=1 Tax=Mollisia scopiformis TaxID=149040 RepID=A0A194X3A6_MOLSC|nr:uncharacterized protein LY89DRAFT_736536 [Mollisia scopiformis]KUJ14504.1 hypothetical protein LY89DRAFT_736536 [Mollisia scopiformis]
MENVSFNKIKAHGEAVDPQPSSFHTWYWVHDQNERSHVPEITYLFSEEDRRQIQANPAASTRSGRPFKANVPPPLEYNDFWADQGSRELDGYIVRRDIASETLEQRKRRAIKAEKLEERRVRAEALQRKIHWAFIDAKATELTEDFLRALAAPVKSEGDNWILRWYWSSGLSLDLTMEPDQLRNAIWPDQYLSNRYIFEAGYEERCRKMDHIEDATRPTTPLKKQRMCSPTRITQMGVDEDKALDEREPVLVHYYNMIGGAYVIPARRARQQESFERSHIRSSSRFDLVNGPVRTTEEENKTQDSQQATERPPSPSQRKFIEVGLALMLKNSKLGKVKGFKIKEEEVDVEMVDREQSSAVSAIDEIKTEDTMEIKTEDMMEIKQETRSTVKEISSVESAWHDIA